MTRRLATLAGALFAFAWSASAAEPAATPSALCQAATSLEEALFQPEVSAVPAEPMVRFGCSEECIVAYYNCPVQCGVSYQECYSAHLVCLDSCVRGVGPWLPC